MASILVVVTTLTVLSASSTAAGAPLVRREQQKQEKQVSFHANSRGEKEIDAAAIEVSADITDDMSICDSVYVHGKKNSNDCAPSAERMMNPYDCHIARHHYEEQQKKQQALLQIDQGRKIGDDIIELKEGDYLSYPKGCSKAPCPNGDGSLCFFYNSVERTENLKISNGAETVCRNHKFAGAVAALKQKLHKNGESVAAEKESCGAPGYSVIQDFVECKKASKCLPYGYNTPFRRDIEPAEQHIKDFDLDRKKTHDKQVELYNEYPKGCFLDPVNKRVSFNEQPKGISVLPKKPKGIPLCRFKSTVVVAQ